VSRVAAVCTQRGHVRVAVSQLETEFLSYVRTLQPDPDYNELLQALLIETLRAKTEEAAKRSRTMQSQLLACDAHMRKLKDRYLYSAPPLSEEIWKEESQRLNAEKREMEHEMALLQQRATTDHGELIRFAGRLFGQAADVWRAATAEQRERLQLAYFPEGLDYRDGNFRTARMSVFFKDLGRRTREREGWRPQRVARARGQKKSPASCRRRRQQTASGNAGRFRLRQVDDADGRRNAILGRRRSRDPKAGRFAGFNMVRTSLSFLAALARSR
jgi:hypothetical protein